MTGIEHTNLKKQAKQKPFPCRKCIKSSREYDSFTRTLHLLCSEHYTWCQYAARKCNPPAEWEKSNDQN
jgi:hypothetical protein